MNKQELETRVGQWAQRTFVLNYDYPARDYAARFRRIWCRVIELAANDYLCYKFSANPLEQQYYYNARDFLFDPGYRINFGNREISSDELLDMLNINPDWFRAHLIAKEKLLSRRKDYSPGTQLPLF